VRYSSITAAPMSAFANEWRTSVGEQTQD